MPIFLQNHLLPLVPFLLRIPLPLGCALHNLCLLVKLLITSTPLPFPPPTLNTTLSSTGPTPPELLPFCPTALFATTVFASSYRCFSLATGSVGCSRITLRISNGRGRRSVL